MNTMPKFLISDCDYTLVDFYHEGGIKALRDNPALSYLAEPMDSYFQNILQGMRLGGGDKFAKIKADLEQLANEVVTGEDKLADAVWSRELWMYHYLSDLPKQERFEKSQQASDIYWRGLGQSSSIYEDTPLFVERLRENKFHVALVTSSDGRLTLNEEKNRFIYSPQKAKRLKTERYEMCGFGELFDLQNELFIGDPIAKPHQIFWEETLRELEIEPSKNNHIVVIGDSYETDLKGASWFKSQAILLDRNNKHAGAHDLPAADHVAHDLKEALQFIL